MVVQRHTAATLWERDTMNRITAVVAGLSLAFVGTSTTFAATINVPGDHATIYDAINASSNGDVIAIAAGTYIEHPLSTHGKAITIGSASGNLDVTIDFDHYGGVFIGDGEGSGTVIQNLVLTGAYAWIGGGGIYCDNSNPTITGCTIANNTTDWYGGGIYLTGSSPTISGCTISGNSTSGGDDSVNGEAWPWGPSGGGGIYCNNNSNPNITDCTITGNAAPGTNGGGGILCHNNSNPTISGCTISLNTAGNNGGGGIYLSGWTGASGCSPTITDTVIVANTASPTNGGGISCHNHSNPTIIGCAILLNTATYDGGGIFCKNSSPTITDVVIGENVANMLKTGGVAAVNSNCIISGCYIAGNVGQNLSSTSVRGEQTPSFITLENTTVCGTGEHVQGQIIHLGENHISDCVDDGDLNGDGEVDTADLDALHAAAGICKSDVNHDGDTNVLDLLAVIDEWGGTCP